MPKVVTFDFQVDGSPAQIAGKLRSHVVGGSVRGWVETSRFELSPASKPFSGRVRPSARGRLEEVAPGRTRVVGRCGSPAFAVWYFRGAVVVLATFLGWMAWSIVAESGFLALPAIAVAMVFLSIAFTGVGFNIGSSDAQVVPLVDGIQRACGAVTAVGGEATRQTE